MKIFVISILVILMSVFTLTFSQDNAEESITRGTLKVIVEGLKSDSGSVQIGLFNTEDSWEDKEEKFKGAIIPIKDKKVEWVLENIPYGEYAVRFYHDENNNNELDGNFIGIPTESYGFSNNAKAIFSMPSYDKAKFVFDSDHTIEIIRI
jgi:uncharacterized protein (DUF2141 family)